MRTCATGKSKVRRWARFFTAKKGTAGLGVIKCMKVWFQDGSNRAPQMGTQHYRGVVCQEHSLPDPTNCAWWEAEDGQRAETGVPALTFTLQRPCVSSFCAHRISCINICSGLGRGTYSVCILQIYILWFADVNMSFWCQIAWWNLHYMGNLAKRAFWGSSAMQKHPILRPTALAAPDNGPKQVL